MSLRRLLDLQYLSVSSGLNNKPEHLCFRNHLHQRRDPRLKHEIRRMMSDAGLPLDESNVTCCRARACSLVCSRHLGWQNAHFTKRQILPAIIQGRLPKHRRWYSGSTGQKVAYLPRAGQPAGTDAARHSELSADEFADWPSMPFAPSPVLYPMSAFCISVVICPLVLLLAMVA